MAVFVAFALFVCATTAAAPSVAAPADALAAQPDINPDTVRLHVTVRPDGTAEWTVEYRIDLGGEGEDRTEAFQSLQEDIAANPQPYVENFTAVLAPSVDRAGTETGREMALRNASVSTRRESLSRPTGIVTYRFEWAAFAATDGESILVGDALSGFYVDEETTLRIEWPDGYEPTDVRPQAKERTADAAIWHGPTDFGADEPRIRLEPEGLDVPMSLAAVAALLLVAMLGIVGRMRGGSAGDGTETATEATEASEDSPPMELLSNEERVIAVLKDNGGRMKQQTLAEELEWGAPKTSRVVNGLREEEAVEVFRIGRENVVTLPEEELL